MVRRKQPFPQRCLPVMYFGVVETEKDSIPIQKQTIKLSFQNVREMFELMYDNGMRTFRISELDSNIQHFLTKHHRHNIWLMRKYGVIKHHGTGKFEKDRLYDILHGC